MSESINQSEEYQKLKAQYDKLNTDWLALDKENEILKKQNQNLKWGMERYQRCVDDVSKQEGKYNTMTHEQMAGEVRMLTRTQLNHEAICCSARDRIIYLADLVADLTDVIEQTLPQNLLVIDSLKFGDWFANVVSKSSSLQIDMPNFIVKGNKVHLGKVNPQPFKKTMSEDTGNYTETEAQRIVIEHSRQLNEVKPKLPKVIAHGASGNFSGNIEPYKQNDKNNNLNSKGEERIGDGLLNIGHEEHMKKLKTMSAQDFDDVLKINALKTTSENIKNEIDNSWFIKKKDKMSPAKKLLENKRLERQSKLNVK